MNALQLRFALHPTIHGMFRQKIPEKCWSVGVECVGPRPPKAEAPGSNPVGCTSFPTVFERIGAAGAGAGVSPGNRRVPSQAGRSWPIVPL